MKFALQVEDKDFDRARELLGEDYDAKSNLLIFDPLTGEPPAGQFVLIAISDIWLQKYADRISGYMKGLEDIKGLTKTAKYLEFGREEKMKSVSEREVVNPKIAAEDSNEILPAEKPEDSLNISQDEEVKNFYLEPENPSFIKVEAKEENSNDFSFEFGEEKEEETKIEEKILKEEEAKEEETIFTQAVDIATVSATASTLEAGEIKRIYLSSSDMAYTVGVGIHIKYSSKVIAIVDEKMFQKYGEDLDENVYIFKTFREVEESSLQNYILIITAKDKAKDEEILGYSLNPIAYWEEINRWAEKQI
jgi:hypothetical protein